MDYTREALSFKMKKALRYIRLYGPRRTWAKIEAQYHMQRRYTNLPKAVGPNRDKAHIGIIGCGNYAYSTIAYYLKRNFGYVIRASMDKDINRAASLFERYGLTYYTDDAERLLNDARIDTVFIASNHASHAEYAIRALENGKNVHIEKPHVVNEDQLDRLCKAMADSRGGVNLGFSRPVSRLGREIKRSLDSQTGASMCNWFVAGHEIPPDHWYFSDKEGGRVLGNLCHWTDFSYQMVAPEKRYPITINPTRAEQSDCDIAITYRFGDGSITIITFSAKGHTFEGVKERFSAHRGNVLLAMNDFKTLVIEDVDRKRIVANRFRDHGHERAICTSYILSSSQAKRKGCSIAYVWETGQLFLQTKRALEQNQALSVEAYDGRFPYTRENTATQ